MFNTQVSSKNLNVPAYCAFTYLRRSKAGRQARVQTIYVWMPTESVGMRRNKRQIALMLLATIISSNHNKRWKPKERVSWRLLVLFLPFQDTGRTINKSACGCKVKG